MSVVFSREGVRWLQLSWMALGLSVMIAAGLALSGFWHLQSERKAAVVSASRLKESRSRTEAVRREIEDLRASSEVFKDLLDRGFLREESRLDIIERLDRMKADHKILALEYEIEPQRVLPLAGGRVFGSLDVMGSKVKIRLKALHEGDALAFLEDLSRPPRGFTPVNQCHLQRIDRLDSDVRSPRVEASCTLEWVSLREKGTVRAK